MFDWPAFIANLLGLASVILLAIPAIHVSRYALKAAQISALRPVFRDQRMREQIDRTIGELNAIRDSWSDGKARCLVLGIVAGAASYALPVLANAPAAWSVLTG